MTDEEREYYSKAMLALGVSYGALTLIRDLAKKMDKTTGFPDFHGAAANALEIVEPALQEIWEFNKRTEG